jgi:hypothetical protein
MEFSVEPCEQNIKFRGYLKVAKGTYWVKTSRHEAAAGVITQCSGHGRHSLVDLDGWKLTL